MSQKSRIPLFLDKISRVLRGKMASRDQNLRPSATYKHAVLVKDKVSQRLMA